MTPEKHTDDKDDFDERLAKARAETGMDESKTNGATRDHSLSHGYRMGLEFVSAVAVGAFIGYWLDRWFDTAPLFLIVLLLTGTVAGIRNLMRLLKPIDETSPVKDMDSDQNDDQDDDTSP